jgi:hypothetical protein
MSLVVSLPSGKEARAADLGQRPPINVQKVLWCCGELDIRYQRVDVGGPFGGNRDLSSCG